jgi:hypothetical protein
MTSNKSRIVAVVSSEHLLSLEKEIRRRVETWAKANELPWLLGGGPVYGPAVRPLNLLNWVFPGLGTLAEFASFYRRRMPADLVRSIEEFEALQAASETVDPAEAAERFEFEEGHPIDGRIYVRHPVYDNICLIPSTANEQIVREHWGAFEEILVKLGAKRVVFKSYHSIEESIDGAVKIPFPKIATTFGLKLSTDTTTSRSEQTVMEFFEPKVPAHVPDQLEDWLGFDYQLATLTRRRLDGHLSKLSTHLEIGGSTVVSTDFSATVLRFKPAAIGGNYSFVSRARLDFEVEFWPLPTS